MSVDAVTRLYTPAMLAELVRTPLPAIRHWRRKGHLVPARIVGRLAYFNFEQVRVARRLGELLSAGCKLSRIDRKLAELARQRPQVGQALADPAVVIEGTRLFIRRGESLFEPSGQLLIDFDAPIEMSDQSVTIPIRGGRPGTESREICGESLSLGSAELRSLADDFEENGESERAIEVYRALLMTGQFTAEDQFTLAELLYRSGDLAGARERYYAAIEMDEEYVEARANLACVLAEQGEHALAEAAFRGAIKYHPEFADAHYHLARLLDAMGQSAEASRHWRRFLELAPASPWAEEALDRMGAR